ncbi:MAG: AhpC/TSA family protein [Bacteroidetes bacterium]|jgi:thiol-disulfide isomerase/thioredoxin|nr:AhpC/TSA family protein [Bacteroidota bacterium]
MNFKTIVGAITIAAFAACSNSNSENGFELTGKFSNSKGETVIFEQMAPDGLKSLDTAVIDENGEIKITAVIPEKGFYRLKISDKNFATFIIDTNEKVIVGGDAADLGNTYTVEGSPDSKLFWEINQASMKNYRKRDSLQKAFQNFVNMSQMDSIKIDSMSNELEKPYMALVEEHNKFLQNFVKKNTTSFAALAAIQQLPPEEFLETYLKLDKGLFGKYPNSTYIKAFHDGVASQRKLALGTPAPEIVMNTPDGKPLALSSLKGKIVLVDFWASWCGPCRAENPTVVKAYNKYKSKGFDIYSVSLDKDLDKWKEAIKKDNLTWNNHVCDFKFWQSPVVALYNFDGIPYNVLIDKDGNILAKSLRGEDLEKKLEELLK